MNWYAWSALALGMFSIVAGSCGESKKKPNRTLGTSMGSFTPIDWDGANDYEKNALSISE